jgi:hypothetical protein
MQTSTRTRVWELVRRDRFKRKYNEYEPFIKIVARAFSRNRSLDRQDYEQVGRIALWRNFERIEDGYEVRDEGAYYRSVIRNAMRDFYRTRHETNVEIYEYDGPKPRVKRFKYGGKVKGRIQYHGDKLKRVHEGHTPVTSLDYLEEACGIYEKLPE